MKCDVFLLCIIANIIRVEKKGCASSGGRTASLLGPRVRLSTRALCRPRRREASRLIRVLVRSSSGSGTVVEPTGAVKITGAERGAGAPLEQPAGTVSILAHSSTAPHPAACIEASREIRPESAANIVIDAGPAPPLRGRVWYSGPVLSRDRVTPASDLVNLVPLRDPYLEGVVPPKNRRSGGRMRMRGGSGHTVAARHLRAPSRMNLNRGQAVSISQAGVMDQV